MKEHEDMNEAVQGEGVLDSSGKKIRLQLSDQLFQRLSGAVQILKARRSAAKVEDILADYIETISDEYISRKIDELTPDEYYLYAARELPELSELRSLIVSKAKLILNRKHSPRSQGRRKRKNTATELTIDKS